jgi:transcriptional regulator GlxA family with amidase domain
MTEIQKKRIVGVLFPDFTALDFYGPISIFKYAVTDKQSRTPLYIYNTTTLTEHRTASCEGVTVEAQYSFNELPDKDSIDVLIIPGGLGTRQLANNEEVIARLRVLAEKANYVLTICTGSALLARTGLLNGIQATSNKFSWDWVVQQGPQVQWKHEARWVDSGKITTSAGVSAGIDMTLYWVAKHYGFECAKRAAEMIEYSWRGITTPIGLETDHQFSYETKSTS